MDGCGLGRTYTIWRNNLCYTIGASAIQSSLTKYYNCGANTCSSIPGFNNAVQASTQAKSNLIDLGAKILSTFRFTK